MGGPFFFLQPAIPMSAVISKTGTKMRFKRFKIYLLLQVQAATFKQPTILPLIPAPAALLARLSRQD
jgi:hypothetical protein